MQETLQIVEKFCIENDDTVNPHKISCKSRYNISNAEEEYLVLVMKT